MKQYVLIFLVSASLLHVKGVLAQTAAQDSAIIKTLETLNRRIDHAVVSKDFKMLDQHYADDFIFTHGTGLIDSKHSWLESVKKNRGYASREHDSTIVEVHKDIAIIIGKLTVGRLEPAKDGTTKYSLRYVRVFALRKKNWEMDFSSHDRGMALLIS